MSRTLTLLFRRDPSCDRLTDKNIPREGYRICWPDGQPVALGIDSLCYHGQRLLGLGKHLKGCQEKLVEMRMFPLACREDDLVRIPGHRVRRFYVQRQGDAGIIHFMDGTATSVTFDIHRDEPHVLQWLGLLELHDGEQRWFDLAAVAVETPVVRPAHSALQLQACEA